VDYDEFIGRVQSRGDMSSRGEAERAVRAVLTALGEHLDESEADKLASRLPREVSGYLRQERTEHGPVLLLPVFQERVGRMAGVDPPGGTVYTATVCRVLEDAVPSDKLPGKLAPLFSFG
jgi:uncharacterized protein (DUF2267 family)